MSSQDSSRKRGRPAKYATKEEKALVDVQRKRAKRQHQTSERHRTICNQTYESSFFPTSDIQRISSVNSNGALPVITNNTIEPHLTLSDNVGDFGALSQYLPPPSPELDATNTVDYESDIAPLAALSTCNSVPVASATSEPDVDEDTIVVASQQPRDPSASDDDNDSTRIERLADRLLDQLVGFHGCCAECHDQAKAEHSDQSEQHTSLSTYLDSVTGLCPDILGTNRIASQEDNLSSATTANDRRRLYCGLEGNDNAPHICLHADEPQTNYAGMTFDIDSVTGFPSSIAIAKQGIRWHPTQMLVSDLQSSLHMTTKAAHFVDSHGHAHNVRRPLHQLPHYTFGRLIGLEDVSIYILFPRLYREDQGSARLRDVDFQLWMDGVLLPAIYRHQSSSCVQHYPSSDDHSRSNATARGVEQRAQRIDPIAREQQLMSFLRPNSLHPIWQSVLAGVQRPGYHQFSDMIILLHAKNLKVLTKDETWQQMIDRFRKYWTPVVNEEYVTPLFYYDVGKEICPQQPSHIAVDPSNPSSFESIETISAETLVWKRCCLEACSSTLKQGLPQDAVKEIYYPFSMLHDSVSLTIEPCLSSGWRHECLPYSQFYSSVKEVFAAGDVYPFTNPAIESLALDRKLRRTWEHVGKGLSHNPVALMKAYLYAKWRCHSGLRGSTKKSFGVREEHRMSDRLFRAIDERFRERGLHQQHLTIPIGPTAPYYSFRTTTMLRWLRWNINKFCVGFETVFSSQSSHFITWEHTRLMLMFLRCLRVSYGSGLIQKSAGCWRDVRYVPNDQEPDGLRRVEGLGFSQTIKKFGYAWFMDKVDWATLTFRLAHSPYMMFNNPSMQIAYRAHYGQIRDVRIDFVRINRVRQWMVEYSNIPACIKYLDEYLRQLCLCAFRKDVFTHIQATLRPEFVEAALAGQIPLCYESIQEALQDRYRPLQIASGKQVAVKNIDVLFAWLWEWSDGQFERRSWKNKPYRMLYQQSSESIVSLRGKDAARSWRRELKASFLRSHWVIPYPDNRSFLRRNKESGKATWWPSFHSGLYEYYSGLRRQQGGRGHLPASNIPHHPTQGWHLGGQSHRKTYMPFVVELETDLLDRADEEFHQELVRLSTAAGVDEAVHGDEESRATWGAKARKRRVQIEYRRWCPQRRRDVEVTVEDCRTAQDYRIFLEEEKEKYQGFETGIRRSGRKPGQNRVKEVELSSSESEGVAEDEGRDETSDEESLAQKRRRQKQAVRKMQGLVEESEAREGASESGERRGEGEEKGIYRLRIVRHSNGGTSAEESDGSLGSSREEE